MRPNSARDSVTQRDNGFVREQSSGGRRALRVGRYPTRYHALGKHDHRRRDEEEDSTTTSDASTDSGESSDREQKPERRRGNTAVSSKTHWVLDGAIALVIMLLIAAGLYIYHQSSSKTASPASSFTSPSSAGAGGATAAAPVSSEGGLPSNSGTKATSAGSAKATNTPSATGTPGAAATAASHSSDKGSSSSSSASSAASAAGSAVAGAPADFSAITLAGTFVATDAYTIATGTLADVPGPSSTVALDGLTTSANPAKETTGAIYVGDSTWYAAGEGGYGSCGQKLYDGQQPYFAAMSLYHWMGSPGPSPHCWSCVQLQSVAHPDKVITALVADSCEACEFAHIDLEQAAYYALGGTVGSGVVTVAWMFVDCPSDHSEAAVAALGSSAYKAVDLS